MIVIKRNGSRQEFDEAKIRSSIEITSDEIKQPMSSGDLNYAVRKAAGMRCFPGIST